MTLLVTVLAAIAATTIWYFKDAENKKKTGTLSLIYWGASAMWFVDALFGYAEQKAAYFTPSLEELWNDFFLGICAIALGLIIWLALLLYQDPRGIFRKDSAKGSGK